MTDTDANIAIAEWIGWKRVKLDDGLHWARPGDAVAHGFRPPFYTSDLDAMHEAELHFRKLHPDKIEAWCEVLMDLTPNEPDYVRILGYLSAPAPQRTRALLVMLGLWRE